MIILIEYIVDVGPDGNPENQVNIMKMTTEVGKMLKLPIDDAEDGEGILSMWIKGGAQNGII